MIFVERRKKCNIPTSATGKMGREETRDVSRSVKMAFSIQIEVCVFNNVLK